MWLAASSIACSSPDGSNGRTAADYRTEAAYRKPAKGCAPGENAGNRYCAVCNAAQSTDCELKCNSGNGDACAFYGDTLQLHNKDFARAAHTYQRGCSLGSGSSCEALALLLAQGAGVPRDTARAVELLDEMCRAGRAHACTLYAEQRLLTGVLQETEKAAVIRTLERGCRGGDAEGCQLLGDRSSWTDISRAVSEARERVASCGLGDAAACAIAVTILGPDEH